MSFQKNILPCHLKSCIWLSNFTITLLLKYFSIPCEGIHTLKPFFISIKPFYGACTCQNREVHPKVYYFSIENMRLYNVILQFGARIYSLHWSAVYTALHRCAFCQSSFCWIYYCGSNKSTGKQTGKPHLCALEKSELSK